MTQSLLLSCDDDKRTRITTMNNEITRWLQRDPDPKSRQELQQLVADNATAELADRFNGRLEFGTAGLRGVVGAGPNRMNRLVIQETATGLGRVSITYR